MGELSLGVNVTSFYNLNNIFQNLCILMKILGGISHLVCGGRLDRFRRVKAPSTAQLSQLTYTIAHRIARYLERQGCPGFQTQCEPDGAAQV